MTALAHLWDLPWENLSLSSRGIHVWCASLDQSASAFQQLSKTLSADERMRAERFYYERDRKRFIVRRGLLRTILDCYLGIEPDRLHFRYGAHGKPKLAETLKGDNLRFNLSHSHGLALYAIARDQEIGVDIECVRPIPEAKQIAENYFSTREYDDFRALSEQERLVAFFNCWTRKEAYLKALGFGLTRSLDEFDVSLAPGESARLLSIKGDPEKASRWFLQDLMPASNYVAALAVKGQDAQFTFWQLGSCLPGTKTSILEPNRVRDTAKKRNYRRKHE